MHPLKEVQSKTIFNTTITKKDFQLYWGCKFPETAKVVSYLRTFFMKSKSFYISSKFGKITFQKHLNLIDYKRIAKITCKLSESIFTLNFCPGCFYGNQKIAMAI